MSKSMVLMVQLVLAIGLPYLIWVAIRRVVPLVVLQIVTGILLGPSVLGSFAPGFFSMVFPAASLDGIATLGTFAIIAFIFIAGLHFDFTEIKGHGPTFSAAALGSVIVPVMAGWGLGIAALHVYGVAGARGDEFSFGLGMGIALGVTAVPVLGMILREMGMMKTSLGQLALGMAVFSEVFLWVLLAVLMAYLSGGRGETVVLFGVETAAFVAMAILMGQGLERVLPDGAAVPEWGFVLVAVGLFVFAFIGDLIGVHYVFGAFLFGAVLPKRMAESLCERIEPVVVTMLLPMFFINTGLRLRVGLDSDWIMLAVVATAVSMAAKVVGVVLPTVLVGGRWRTALPVAAFMQCKGLMEVIVLTILLDAGVISQRTFVALVVMALVTTVVTKPLVRVAMRVADSSKLRTGEGDRVES
jgi:Kef-type K+ transport system membrane component KefB